MLKALAAAMTALNLIPGEETIRQDSKYTAALAKQLEYVKTRTYDEVFPAFKARQLIPVSNEADSGAETIVYRSWTMTGMAQIIANYADDIPLVDALVEEFSQKVVGMALGWTYSIQDLRRSAMSGANLPTRKAMATRRGIEQRIEDMGALGDSSVGMTGIANNPNVTLVTPLTGTWSTASGPQMVKDLLHLESSIVIANKETFAPTTIVLDIASYNRLASTRMSTTGDSNWTALKAFLDTAAYVTEVVSWNKLAKADASLTGPRAICYAKTPEVLTLEIPQEFETFPPQPKNFSFKVPAHARCGGVVWYYPIGGGYMDGL